MSREFVIWAVAARGSHTEKAIETFRTPLILLLSPCILEMPTGKSTHKKKRAKEIEEVMRKT